MKNSLWNMLKSCGSSSTFSSNETGKDKFFESQASRSNVSNALQARVSKSENIRLLRSKSIAIEPSNSFVDADTPPLTGMNSRPTSPRGPSSSEIKPDQDPASSHQTNEIFGYVMDRSSFMYGGDVNVAPRDIFNMMMTNKKFNSRLPEAMAAAAAEKGNNIYKIENPDDFIASIDRLEASDAYIVINNATKAYPGPGQCYTFVNEHCDIGDNKIFSALLGKVEKMQQPSAQLIGNLIENYMESCSEPQDCNDRFFDRLMNEIKRLPTFERSEPLLAMANQLNNMHSKKHKISFNDIASVAHTLPSTQAKSIYAVLVDFKNGYTKEADRRVFMQILEQRDLGHDGLAQG